VNWLEVLGYVGGLLVFSTFYLKTMIRLRLVAIASNVVYVAYALMGHMVPILVLHILLLPLNIWRLVEVKRLIRKVRASAQTGMAAPELIVPYMRKVRRKKGDAVFAKGDSADCVYYVFEGAARLTDKNIVVPRGQMLGIMGIFSREHRRTDTAVCLSDVELGVISKDRILELFYQSPDFGAFLIRMVAQRAELDNPQRTAGAQLAAAMSNWATKRQ
jgi:CRP/FNR family transcriptional regulator, cyclic AMP receptor protein